MELYTDRKALTNAIAGLGRTKIDEKIQQLLISAFYHRMLSGDNTFISGVLNAMPKGSRVTAARQYCEHYMFVKVGKDKNKQFKCKNTENLKDEIDEQYLQDVSDVPWWEFKADNTPEYDGAKLLEKIRKQVNKAIETAQENGDDATAEELAKLLA